MKVNIKRQGNKDLMSIGYSKVIRYGIPKTTSQRPVDEGEKVELNNAEILQILEAGSIRNNLPARKLLGPVREKYQDQIKKSFENIFKALMDNDETKADQLMEELALKIQKWTQAYFTQDNGWEPNAYITIHGGWMKNKVTGQLIYVKGKGSDKPLIDTARLRKAIRGLVVDISE